MLKAHGTKRLTVKYDTLLSSFDFNFNVRFYSEGQPELQSTVLNSRHEAAKRNVDKESKRHPRDQNTVGRCRLTPSCTGSRV